VREVKNLITELPLLTNTHHISTDVEYITELPYLFFLYME